MDNASQIQLLKAIEIISEYRKERLNDALKLLQEIDGISGILLGGSVSYKADISNSDIDLFCLIDDFKTNEESIVSYLSKLTDADFVIYQGYFPWTENLYTVYFKGDKAFTLDISLVKSEKAEIFFWEPNGHILYDEFGIIKESRSNQISKPDYTKQPLLKTNPFTMAVISIKKIEKNLCRGHLWNAIDQVRNLRRYLMQVVRIYVIQNTNFLGRVDREIEDVIPDKLNEKFINTIPMYNSKDIAEKALILSEVAEEFIEHIAGTKEEFLKDWILKHLFYERGKLLKYCH